MKEVLKQAGVMHYHIKQLKLLYPYCAFLLWYGILSTVGISQF